MATTPDPDAENQTIQRDRKQVLREFMRDEVVPPTRFATVRPKLTYGAMALFVIVGLCLVTAPTPVNLAGVAALVLLVLSWPR